MKAARITLTALALLAILAQSALCQQVWQEQRITGDGAYPGAPQMYGNAVYWSDGRSYPKGYNEIRAWDPVGGERVITQVPLAATLDAVYGQTFVYEKRVGNYTDLYMWDPVGGERLVSNAPNYQFRATLSDKLVVWEDRRSGKGQIYVWDPVNGQRQISPTSTEQNYPRVWGDTVVWEDDRNSTQYTYRRDVYMWNPRDGERRLSTYIHGMHSPTIYDDRVLMWATGEHVFTEDRGLWEWTSQHGLRQLGQRDYTDPYSVMHPRMWGDLLVWQSGIDIGRNVGAWDPVHGFTRVNQSSIGNAGMPSVYGNKVAWAGNNGIYLSALVPEPSGLVALGGLAGLALTALRRRRVQC